MRILIVLHRYLGVLVGLLMALWCLSGFVMMYQPYPSMAPEARLKGLQPLALSGLKAPADLPDDGAVSSFRIEMLAGKPVLKVSRGPRRRQMFDLSSGQQIDGAGPGEALAVAKAYAAGNGVAGQPKALGVVEVDQWTVQDARRDGPSQHFRFDDAGKTELYVSQQSGEAVQMTTGGIRLLSWFGAIPHWLYLTQLRRDGRLWNDVVVYTSLIGTFLTVIGLYVGISRFKRYKSGRWSPYRGWFYWHHITGLVFGLLTLTWVASGLFTMNPWGFLDSSAGGAERGRYAGTLTGADVKRVLAAGAAFSRPDLAQLEAAPVGGRLYVLARGRDGSVTRLDDQGRPAPVTADEVRGALAKAAGAPIASFARIDGGDAYYYANYNRAAAPPAYRAILADKGKTALYVDAQTGRMVFAHDTVGRQSRWLRTGLHDFDFFGGLRARPAWDIVVLILLAGVTGVSLTGLYMAVWRVARDVGGLWVRFRRP